MNSGGASGVAVRSGGSWGARYYSLVNFTTKRIIPNSISLNSANITGFSSDYSTGSSYNYPLSISVGNQSITSVSLYTAVGSATSATGILSFTYIDVSAEL